MTDQLTKDEMRLLLQVIDLSSARGIFRGSEMAAVGHVYQKITAIVEAPEQDATAE